MTGGTSSTGGSTTVHAGAETMSVPYQLKNGKSVNFVIDQSETFPFGFNFQDRVETPRGLANVIGIREGNLWFHVDGDPGATFWSSCRCETDFLNRGFRKVQEEHPPVDPNEYHKLKTVMIKGRGDCLLVMQNINGPCPIIALANALLVSGKLQLLDYTGKTFIQSEKLKTEILKYMLTPRTIPKFECPAELEGREVLSGMVQRTCDTFRLAITTSEEEGMGMLSRFYEGLNVNPAFSHIDAFEAEEDQCLFSLAGLRVVHGWLISAEDNENSSFREKPYIEVAAIAMDDTAANNAAASKFLNNNMSQLTEFGINHLKDELAEGEVTVFFHNNHFSTLVKVEGRLLVVVSDEGYTDRKSIVFEELTVLGNGTFFDGSGVEVPEWLLALISQYGDHFKTEEIEKALRALELENKEVTTAAIVDLLEKTKKPPAPQTATDTTTADLGRVSENTPVAAVVPETSTVSEALGQLTAMGFDPATAGTALDACDGSVERALEMLFSAQ